MHTPEEIEILYKTHGDLVPFEIYNTLFAYVNANTMDSENNFTIASTYLMLVEFSPKSQSNTSGSHIGLDYML